jgi:hypothetical protein
LPFAHAGASGEPDYPTVELFFQATFGGHLILDPMNVKERLHEN